MPDTDNRGPAQQIRLLERHATDGVSQSLRYLLFLPKVYGRDKNRLWPLILFLHGAGERGSNIELLKRHGIPRVVENQPEFPFVAVSPQCAQGSSWQMHMRALDRLLAETMAQFAVDPGRMYLTGISMGGGGTWALGAENPDRFAALAPICGFGTPSLGFPERVCRLRNVPVWTFHGALDDIVPMAATEELVNRLRECGGTVRFTVYPDAGHDSWTRTYDNPAFYEWLLLQHR